MDLRDRYLNQQQLAAVLGLLLPKYARWHILKVGDLGTCIWGTKVALRVMEHYGVLNPRGTAVRVMVGNERYAAMLQHRAPPRDQVELAEWQRQGAFVTGCGWGEAPKDDDSWPGHVVALADEFLVDLTADQFARPQNAIEVESLACRVTSAFVEGRERAVYITEGGCLVIYEISTDESWRETPAWNDTPEVVTQLTVERIIEDIDAVQDVDDLLTAVGIS